MERKQPERWEGGWKSSYDYDRMSNADKYFGRMLHVQDAYWTLFTWLIIPAILLVIYILKSPSVSSIDFSGIESFASFLR